jgi:hypothetical protein
MLWLATHDTFLESSYSQHQLCLELQVVPLPSISPKVIESWWCQPYYCWTLRELREFYEVDMALMERGRCLSICLRYVNHQRVVLSASGGGKHRLKKFVFEGEQRDIHR